LGGIVASHSITAAAKSKKFTGKVVSLSDVVSGKKDLQLTKEKATELLAANSPLVFLVGSKVYFVQNADGSYAFKKLADFAHNTKVYITGTTKTTKGINMIYMEEINKAE
jgi:hypothetical protein